MNMLYKICETNQTDNPDGICDDGNFFIIHDKDISKDENILNTGDNIYYIS